MNEEAHAGGGALRAPPMTTPTRGNWMHSRPRSSLVTPSLSNLIFGVSSIGTSTHISYLLAEGMRECVTWRGMCAQRADDICHSARHLRAAGASLRPKLDFWASAKRSTEATFPTKFLYFSRARRQLLPHNQ